MEVEFDKLSDSLVKRILKILNAQWAPNELWYTSKILKFLSGVENAAVTYEDYLRKDILQHIHDYRGTCKEWYEEVNSFDRIVDYIDDYNPYVYGHPSLRLLRESDNAIRHYLSLVQEGYCFCDENCGNKLSEEIDSHSDDVIHEADKQLSLEISQISPNLLKKICSICTEDWASSISWSREKIRDYLNGTFNPKTKKDIIQESIIDDILTYSNCEHWANKVESEDLEYYLEGYTSLGAECSDQMLGLIASVESEECVCGRKCFGESES
jgi:hypothetical protein